MYSIDKLFKPFKSFSPLKTISVHVSQNNEILVVLTECYPLTFPASKDSVRRVVIINQNGDKQHSYEYDEDNQRLFTEPWRIITLNNNINIIDSLSDQWEGRVIVIDYGGQLLWTYNDCDNYVNKGKFYPTDITETSTDMILVSYIFNYAIHMLAGDVISYKDV